MSDAAAPTSDRVLLQAAGLTRRFGGLAAVQNVSIELRRSEVHAVIGTNGAGKSTLVNMLSGELAPSDGTIRLSRDIPLASPDTRRRLVAERSSRRA